MSLLWKSFASVALFIAFMSWLVYLQFFASAHVEIGFQHYAEVPSLQTVVPKIIKMPLNTIVNLGYIIVGAYWCAMTTVCHEKKFINDFDAFLFYLFNIMSGFYGGIQMLRIITQKHEFAVMDQWCTVPFFMIVLVWGRYLAYGWSAQISMTLVFISLASYTLVLLTPMGFEITLGFHIIAALLGGIIAYRKYPSEEAQYYFVMGLISCGGFVVLKLLDLQLPQYSNIFYYVSGHFLSKVSDIFQIHFVNEYFRSMIVQRQNMEKKLKSE